MRCIMISNVLLENMKYRKIYQKHIGKINKIGGFLFWSNTIEIWA